MKIINEMKIDFLSKSSNESFGRVAVSAFVSQLDPTVAELSDIKTAVSEAVTNAIIHGYQENIGIVHITCTLTENNAIITVSDAGRGIEDVKLARTPLYTGAGSGERSGLGFTVMETFMDRIEVSSLLGKGTVVTMQKRVGVAKNQSVCVS